MKDDCDCIQLLYSKCCCLMKPEERSLFPLSNNNSYFPQLQVISLGSRRQTDIEEKIELIGQATHGGQINVNLH